MHSAFTTIKIGPLKTEYHKFTVDKEFKEAFSRYLEQELLPQVDEPYSSTEGTLIPVVNEDRFCGPNSVVRNLYKLNFAFIREHSRDEIDLEILIDVKRQLFKPRYHHRSMFLWTQQRTNEHLKLSNAFESIIERILSGKTNTWQCPRCNSILELIDNKYLFALSCPRSCFVFNRHRDPESGEFTHGHSLSNPLPQPLGE